MNTGANNSDSGGQPNGAPTWLSAVRQFAFDRFSELGFPTRRNEEWKYTDTSPLKELRMLLTDESVGGLVGFEKIGPYVLKGRAHRLVFVDGRYTPTLSSTENSPRGVQVGSLATALDQQSDVLRPFLTGRERISGHEHPFAYLNTALMHDGAFVHISRRSMVEAPIELIFVTSAVRGTPSSFPRVLVIVEEDSQVRLVETYLGVKGDAYLTNAVTELRIGAGAVVDHYKMQRESCEAFHVANMRVHQERGSTFTTHSISIGGRLVRNDINTVLEGEGASCTVNGLYVADGRQHVDNHTSIDHTVPHTDSSQTYKGVMAGQSTAVFNGKVFVRPDAQKTDARQSNRNLLLSDEAVVNTKPQLEIWADDVRCTHGATIGQLDEEALFYARSRGVSAESARQMLTYAFANELLQGFASEEVRELVERDMDSWLPTGKEG